VLGVAGILLGILTLVWQDFNTWQQIEPLGAIPHRDILADIFAAIEIIGGVAIQWRRAARAGAVALGGVFTVFALLWVPRILAHPLTYDPWGNFFEQSSQVAGCLIVFDAGRKQKLARSAYLLFAICVISFMLEQLLNLSATASFVPKWIPPGQMFWSVVTTMAFAAAALALLTGRYALWASRLLTAMIIGFGLLAWLPRLADPHQLFNWAGNAVNLSIAAAAWVVADFLSESADGSRSIAKTTAA